MYEIGEMMQDCNNCISKAFTLAEKLCEKAFMPMYGEEELPKKIVELKSNVFPVLNLMLAYSKNPLEMNDEKEITDTIITAFFKAFELIIYGDFFEEYDVDYTIDGENSVLKIEKEPAKYSEEDVYNFLYYNIIRKHGEIHNTDQLVMIGHTPVRASIIELLCSQDIVNTCQDAKKARTKIAKIAMKIHKDAEAGKISYDELADCADLRSTTAKDMALAMKKCVDELKEKPFRKKNVIRFPDLCLGGCDLFEEIQVHGTLLSAFLEPHNTCYYEDEGMIFVREKNGQCLKLDTDYEKIHVQTTLDPDFKQPDGSPCYYLDGITYNDDPPVFTLKSYMRKKVLSDYAIKEDLDYVLNLDMSAELEVVFRALMYMCLLIRRIRQKDKKAEDEMAVCVSMDNLQWKEFLKDKELLFNEKTSWGR